MSPSWNSWPAIRRWRFALKKNERLELTVRTVRHQSGLSVRRLARCFEVPVACAARWVGPLRSSSSRRRSRPVSGRADLRAAVRELCLQDRCRTYGYRRIWALLRRRGWQVERKTVHRIMRESWCSGC